MSKSIEKVYAFAFGVTFIVTLLVLAVKFPTPTAYQYTVFRTIMALAAGGVGAMIPGFLEVEINKWVRAGGALAVFVLVYFYTPAKYVSDGAKAQSVGGDGNMNVANNGTIGAIYFSGKNPNAPVDIVGLWDEHSAETLARTSLKAHMLQGNTSENDEKDDDGDDPSPSHAIFKLIQSSDVPYRDHSDKILSFSTEADDNSFSCHICIPHISFFEFEQRERGWKLIRSDINAFRAGTFGTFDEEELSVRPIGDNIFGAFVKSCDMHQGVGECALDMHAEIGGNFKNLLSLKVSEEDGSREPVRHWDSTIDIVPAPTGLWKIVIRRSGSLHLVDDMTSDEEGGRDLQIADASGRIRAKDVYSFNGSKYTRSDLFQ